MTKSIVLAIRDKHSSLSDDVRQAKDPSVLVPQMDVFLDQIIVAGIEIPPGDERDLLRSLATYWAGIIYDHSPTGMYPKAELEPYTGIDEAEYSLAERLSLLRRPLIILAVAGLLIVVIWVSGMSGMSGMLVFSDGPTSSNTTQLAMTPDAEATALEISSILTQTALFTQDFTPIVSATPDTLPSSTPASETSVPTVSGLSVMLTSPTAGEEIHPEATLMGTYTKLEPGWTIHAILQPVSQAGPFFPVADFHTVPAELRSGEWVIDPAFYSRPELANGERYIVELVVALNDFARRALDSKIKAGFNEFAELPDTVLRMPESATSVTLPAYDAIDEDRLLYSWFAEGESSMEIVSARPDGSEVRQLTFTPSQSEFHPSLSPDGRRIVYVGRTSGGEQGPVHSLQVMDSDGRRAETLLTQGNVIYYERPVWSPNGRFIAYGARVQLMDDEEREYLAWLIYLFDTETGENKLLTEGHTTLRHPTWFPDGNSLLVYGTVHTTESDGLYQIDLQSGEVTVFYDTEAQEAQPAMSPDGKQIAYLQFPEISPESNRDIYVLDVDTKEPLRLTTHDGLDQWPAWHPDGQSIYFETYRFDGIPKVWRTDVDGGSAGPITSGLGSKSAPSLGPMLAFLPKSL